MTKAEEAGALLPCPFCGGSPESNFGRVECSGCGAEMDQRDAAERWNKRSPPMGGPTREAIARLRAKFDWPVAPIGEQEAWIETQWRDHLAFADAVLALSPQPPSAAPTQEDMEAALNKAGFTRPSAYRAINALRPLFPPQPERTGEVAEIILEAREVISGLIGQCRGRGNLTNFERAEVELAEKTLARLRKLSAAPPPPACQDYETAIEVVNDVCVLSALPANDEYERAMHEVGTEIVRRLRLLPSPPIPEAASK